MNNSSIMPSWLAFSSSLNSLAAQRQERQAEIDRLSSMTRTQKALVATLSERVGMRSALVEKEAGTRASMIDAVEELPPKRANGSDRERRTQRSGSGCT